MLGQWISASMQGVTQTFLVYYLTGSAAILGVTSLATALPQITFLLFGGALADRFQKKRLLQLGQMGSCFSALIILVALTTGYLSKEHAGSWWILIMTSMMTGAFNGLAMPARQSMISELVRRDQLMNAVSLNSMGQNITTLVGPSIAGFLIGAVGFKFVYSSMVGLYLLAIILTNFLPATKKVSSLGRTAFVDVKEGLKYVRTDPTILFIIVFNLLCYIMAMPRIQLMPIFAVDILHVGATGQGILQSVGALGGLLASFTLASLPSKKRGFIMLFAGLILGSAIIIFGFSRSYPLSILMMLIIGMGQIGHANIGNVFVQTLADKEYIGRVMSLMLMCQAVAQLGTFFVSIIAEFTGAPLAMASLGMVLSLISIASLMFLPRIRNLN